MTAAEDFARQKYVTVKGLLDPYLVQFLESYYRQALVRGRKNIGHDRTSLNGYGDACADTALYATRAKIEASTGLQLMPAFSFVRFYRKGEKLRRHIDRGANEINVTIQISGDIPWPLGVCVEGEDIIVRQENGDALIYRGLEIPHWREEHAGKEHLQLILAYVIKDGDHADCSFDGKGAPIYNPFGVQESVKKKLMRAGANLRRLIKGQDLID